jgi:uncharacterized damage-inducible protein DinB
MGQEMNDVAKLYLEDSFRAFRGYRHLAEGAIAQVSDDDLFKLIDAEANSIATVMQHIAGNMRSRWTDFLTSDGEKPDRHRDREFEQRRATRDELMKEWNEAWELTLATIQSLKPGDVLREITIRGEKHTVLWAIQRQVTHYAYHVGQIVFLAKHFRGAEWKSLSIPKGKSEEVNQRMAAGEKFQHPLSKSR